MSKAVLITLDGYTEDVELPRGNNLPTMTEAIGCTRIDAVEARRGVDMWIDDEGLYVAPPNHVATLVVAALSGQTPPQIYHGRALFCGVNAEGDSVNLTESQAQIVRHCAGVLREAWQERNV